MMGDHSTSMQEMRTELMNMTPQEMRIELARQAVGMTPQASNSDQLTRDQLLRQRLWAASNDSDAVTEMLADLTKTPPHAGEQQEEGMRSIESSLSLIAWHCKRLKDFVGKGDKT